MRVVRRIVCGVVVGEGGVGKVCRESWLNLRERVADKVFFSERVLFCSFWGFFSGRIYPIGVFTPCGS